MNSNDANAPLNWHPVRHLTIIAERLLKDRILHDLDLLGVTGYTVIESEGRGQRSFMVDEWQGDNVEIQVIARRELIDTVARKLRERYFAHHSIILYAQDVDVLRPEKYGAQ
jgi:nitrogen regulatory protein P-II 2